MKESIAIDEEYHVASRHSAGLKHLLTAHQIHYDDEVMRLMADSPMHVKHAQTVTLPEVLQIGGMSVCKAIVSRSSSRCFSNESLSSTQLSTLLYLANAVRQDNKGGVNTCFQRNVPNSGNLGSVEIYAFVLNVLDIEPGIYHFDTVFHHLARLRSGQFRHWLAAHVLFQAEFAEAAVVLALTSAFGRLKAKYGLRGYRLGLLDTGHVCQNIYLAATALGLNVCGTAGFVDDELDAALALDGLDIATTMVMAVGTRGKRKER